MIIILIIFLLISPIVYSSNELIEKITYHPIYKNIPIPSVIALDKTAILSAPLGRYPQSPILKVYINSQGPFYFMFDTGWAGAMMSREAAKKLNLPIVGNKSYSQITPNQTVEVYENLHYIKEMSIGSIKLKNYAISVNNNFKNDVKLFKKINDLGLDGVLGPNSFYGLMITIDYLNENITLSKESLSPSEIGVIAYSKRFAVPNINLKLNFDKINKKHEQTFIIDTGYYAFIKVNSCKIPEVSQFEDAERIFSYDYTGLENVEHVTQLYGSIDLWPGYSLKNPYVVFSENNCSLDPIGLIGSTFFEKNLVVIDHDDGLVKITKYK